MVAAGGTRRRVGSARHADRSAWFAAGQGWAWETDSRHRFRRIVGPVAQIVGIDPATVVGRSRHDYWSTAVNDPVAWEAHLADLEARRPFRDFVYNTTTPAGRSLTVRVSGAPRFDRRGRFLGYAGTADEITDLADHLRRAEERGRLLQRAEELVGFGHWRGVVGRDDPVWSPQLYAIFGRDPASFVPSVASVVDAIAPEDRARMRALIERRAERHDGYDTELTLLRPCGERRIVRAICEVVPGADRGPATVFGICVDVTDLRRREHEAQERQHLLDQAWDLAKVGAWSLDLRSGAFECSGELDRMFGVTRDHPDPLDAIAQRIVPEHRERVSSAIRRARESGDGYDQEFAFHTPAGERSWARSTCRAEMLGDRPVRLIGAVRDITTGRQREEVLSERTRQLGEAQEIASTGSWHWNRMTRSIHWTDQTFRIFGLEPGGPAPDFARHVELIHPDDREAHVARIEAALASKSSFVSEHRIVRPDGEVRHVVAKGRCEVDAAGEAIGMIGTAQDVTERVRAEHVLREREAELEQAQAIAGIASWRWDLVAGTFTCSEQLYRMAGRKPEPSEQSLSFLELVAHPSDLRRFLRQLRRTVRTGERLVDDLRIVRPDGHVRHLQVTGQPVRDKAGHVIGLAGTTLDVTERRVVEQALRDRERLLAEAQEIAGLGSWSEDLQHGRLDWSDQFWRILGIEPGSCEPQHATYRSLCHPDDVHLLLPRLPDPSTGSVRSATEHRIVRPDGAVRHVHVQTRSSFDASGVLVRVDGTIQDVTERKVAMAALHDQAVMLREAQRAAGLGSSWRRAGDPVAHWSDELYRLLGHEPGTLEPSAETLTRFVHPADLERRAALVEALHAARAAEDEIRIIRADGAVRTLWMRISVEPATDGGKPLICVTHLDVTPLKEAEERLQSLAFFDTLTGTPNRASFLRELDRIVARPSGETSPSAVLLLDLDRFKEVNDTLGHPAGDRLLVEVAERARAQVRAGDMVARLGGDEFAVIVQEVRSGADTAQVAERLLATLRAPFTIEGQEVRIGASIGIARWPQDGSDANALLRNADLALYAVKDAGRDGYRFFEPKLNRIVTERRAIEIDLRNALADDRLSLHYQPQLDIATGRLCGAEALLRWRRNGQDVPPSRFIPVAEGCGLIVELGDWVIARALKDMAALHHATGIELPCAVNVSVAQLRGDSLCQRIADALAQSAMPPRLLHVELTETIFADHADGPTMRMLQRLDDLGVSLALDDFGTGYSSLGYLADMPFSTLKIDRRFVAGIGDRGRSGAIVNAIVSLGRSLGMTVVAEGVETAEQLRFLAGIGCHVAQGYLIGRPMPLPKLRGLLSRPGPQVPVPFGDDLGPSRAAPFSELV